MKLTFINNIGFGGFGIVDKVQHENGEIYARKTYKINIPNFPVSLEDNARQRFIREAKYQKAILHKNIVPVLFDNLTANPPFYLMPLSVSTLLEDVQKDKSLNGKFMNAVMDIIAGLEELHSMKIYHRDLKPANVLRFKGINGDKKDFYAISDFGLMAISQTNVSTLTQTGMRMGSDHYTAPEIVKELKNASAQSDIYSLGCILHDFVGNEDRIPCNEIKENGDFAGILLSCTRKDPSRRFKSVTAFRDALLSLGDVKIQPNTAKGAKIFSVLTKVETELNEEDWKNIIAFIEDEFDSEDAIAALRKLTIQHIDEVIAKYPSLSSKLGLLYANWIRNRSFDFNECDGLSIRLQKFIVSCSIDVQSECLMSMLYLGTGHNRWYVEEKFVGLVGKNLDNNLAKRLAVEIRVDDHDACKAIRHLQHSIKYEINKLHPLLLDTFKEICQ